MSAKASPGTAQPRTVSPWVKAFVVFHIIAITVWSLPNPPASYAQGTQKLGIEGDTLPEKARSLGRTVSDGILVANAHYGKLSPLRFYVLCTGFWQYWDMFAPNPSDTDTFGSAEVTYRDGSVKPFRYPRMYDLSILAKYPSERYRKFYERASSESFSYAWPAFAERVALLSWTEPNNPPVEVRLFRHTLRIPPPPQPIPTQYTVTQYYTHAVDEARLRQITGKAR